ncbi:MAG: DUF3137 domain-containing protein [Bacilli bacterium]|nr:DUF3137 domain-containing protein [Bacilli bacterium]
MIEIDKLCEELKDKYEQQLKGEFEQVAFYRKIQTALIICIVGAILINAFIMLTQRGNFDLFGVVMMMMGLVFGIVIVMVVFSVLTSKKMAAYSRKYDELIGKEMASRFYSDITIFEGDHYEFRQLYRSVGYHESYDRSYCRKQMSLKYKNKDIKLMDILLEEETTDSDGDTHTTTVFNGLFMEVNMGYSIGTRMSITKNYDIGIGKSKLEMDSGEFEKCFNVYTDDKVKSMQLLTSDVMEIFKQMYASTDKYGFDVSFIGDKVYIRVYERGSLFDYGTESVIDKEYINKDMQNLYLVTSILDTIDYAVEANHVL